MASATQILREQAMTQFLEVSGGYRELLQLIRSHLVDDVFDVAEIESLSDQIHHYQTSLAFLVTEQDYRDAMANGERLRNRVNQMKDDYNYHLRTRHTHN